MVSDREQKNFQGHEMGSERKDSAQHDPAQQKRYHRTNEFFHRASEAMGLPWDAGTRVARTIIRNIVRRISPQEACHFISELPIGLKEECSAYANGPLKSIKAEKIKRDILNASGMEGIDPEHIARSFWTFITGWFNEYSDEKRGETHDVLDQLPKDIVELLTKRVVH